MARLASKAECLALYEALSSGHAQVEAADLERAEAAISQSERLLRKMAVEAREMNWIEFKGRG